MRAASFKRRLDLADVGDLAALMEVQQLEAIGHAAALEFFQAAKNLADREAELRAIAARTTASAPSRGRPASPACRSCGRTPIFSA